MTKRILPCILTLVLALSAHAQADLDSIAGWLTGQMSRYTPETVYLQTSKSIYETGEDLWFKAYQLDAQTLTFSALSRTLYLELRGVNDTLVWQEMYPMNGGVAEGHIYLDRELRPGDYFLEAFTAHSFRADTCQLTSERKIKIVENISGYTYLTGTEYTMDTAGSTDAANRTAPVVTSAGEAVMHFSILPEGGNLVGGLPAKLAFKATDGKGNPVDIFGTLFEDGIPLVSFTNIHQGMGSVDFLPRIEKTYHIKLSDGKSYPLPNIYPEGITLHLSGRGKDHLLFTVRQKNARQQPQPFYLAGQQRGIVCSMAKGVLRDSITVKIPLDDFIGQGIVRFTLFTHGLKPVSERLVYLMPEKRLHISLTTEKEIYCTREKAEVAIRVTDENGDPVRAHLGVSVLDEAYNDPAEPVNILAHFHITSQLKGRVHNPAYYFDRENQERTEALDLLMLTQGWSRYVWDPETFVPCGETVITDGIPGRQTFKNERKSKLVGGGEQLVQVFGAEGEAQFVWTDSAGYFTVKPEMLEELRSGYIYLKPMLGEEFTPQIQTIRFFPVIDSLRKVKPHNYPLSSIILQSGREHTDNLPVMSSDSIFLLDELIVVGKKGRVYRDKFMGRLDSLTQHDLNPAWVCECHPHYLNDYRPGYTHHPAGSPMESYERKKLAPVLGETYRIIKYEPNSGGGWYVTDIQYIEYNGPYYSDEELLRMNNIWREKGYYGKREFYQPDEFDILSSVPDSRNTLLWDPAVLTDENGEAIVTFHCSDINNKFVVHVEGAGGDGLLGNAQKGFRVIRNVKGLH